MYLHAMLAAARQAIGRAAGVSRLCAQTELLMGRKRRVTRSRCRSTRIRNLERERKRKRMSEKEKCMNAHKMWKEELLYTHHLRGRAVLWRMQRGKGGVVRQQAGLLTSVHGR